MKTELKNYTVKELCDGFTYCELEGKGLFGLSGKLVIQPEYQRNYLYADGNRDADVIGSLLEGCPIGILYFNKAKGDGLEVLDGQQRITSIGRFVTGNFAIKDENGTMQYFGGLASDKKDIILNASVPAYVCEGTETEIKRWFKTINIAGLPLNNQELLNSVYSGPYVDAAKKEFSNSNNTEIEKRRHYIKGDVKRQDHFERALVWASGGEVEEHMSKNRENGDIGPLKARFDSVLNWASMLFPLPKKEMKGIDWGALHDKYSGNGYDAAKTASRAEELYADPCIRAKKGIFEYVLGGESDACLLNIRLFDEQVKRKAYKAQADDAKEKGTSNCPHCAMGHEANRGKVWKYEEMDADHVTPWSKGGGTDEANCEMLCKTHNRAKGNK